MARLRRKRYQRGKLQVNGRAAEHPFHIHQHPFWLLRIGVSDANGESILPEPRWSDTVALPRNGGYVECRSRFVDDSGEFVDRCPILLHEDDGMLQRIVVVDDAAMANLEPAHAVAAKAESQEGHGIRTPAHGLRILRRGAAKSRRDAGESVETTSAFLDHSRRGDDVLAAA